MYPYLSSALVANRTAALDSVLEVSDILVRAGERYTALALQTGRHALELGRLAAPEPGADVSAHWLEKSSQGATQLAEQAYEIACDTHTALIAAGDSQVKRFDQLARGVLQHAADWAPWEGVVAFDALRSALNTAEHTIHEMTEVATQTIEVAEKEARLVTAAAAPKAPAKQRKRA